MLENIESLKNQYLFKIPIIEIAKKNNVCMATIYNKIRPLNLPKFSNRINSVNENFFENIDNEVKAYWLGFLVGDGNVSITERNSTYQTRLSLQKKDINHIELFKKDLESKAPISLAGGGFSEKDSQAKISIYSKKLVEDLIKLGVVPNKTFKTYFPNISENLKRHFIRGVFDSDGSVFETWRIKGLTFTITGTESLLNSIKNELVKNCNLPNRILTKSGKTKQSYFFTYERKAAEKIFYYLYYDAERYLERKFNTYVNGINKYQLLQN